MKLHSALIAAVETPAVQQRFKEAGVRMASPDRRSPEYLKQFVEREIKKWEGPIKASGAQVD
jgi:tripartite-type tricarboxylate transporter receptor subunit TctC